MHSHSFPSGSSTWDSRVGYRLVENERSITTASRGYAGSKRISTSSGVDPSCVIRCGPLKYQR